MYEKSRILRYNSARKQLSMRAAVKDPHCQRRLNLIRDKFQQRRDRPARERRALVGSSVRNTSVMFNASLNFSQFVRLVQKCTRRTYKKGINVK